MKQFMLLLLTVAGLTYATSKSYDVVPYRNFIGTQEDGEVGVTQYVRNTLDSLSAASVWIGDTFDTCSYNVDVVDSVTPTHVLASKHGVKASQCWAWLNFDLEPDQVNKPVRGRTYKVVVTRPSGGAISFAYDPTNPYLYGRIEIPGDGNRPFDDLALRVYGLHAPVDSTTDWGVTAYMPDSGDPAQDAWGSQMREAGVGWGLLEVRWHELPYNSSCYDFSDLKSKVVQLACSARAEPVVDLMCCAWWASSRIDSVDTVSNDTSWCVGCAARNLWPDSGRTNYWEQFVSTLVDTLDALMDSVHH